MNQKPKLPKERIPSTTLFKLGVVLWVVTWFPCQLFIQNKLLLTLGCGASLFILFIHIGMAITIRMHGLDSHIQKQYRLFVKNKEAEKKKKIKERRKEEE